MDWSAPEAGKRTSRNGLRADWLRLDEAELLAENPADPDDQQPFLRTYSSRPAEWLDRIFHDRDLERLEPELEGPTEGVAGLRLKGKRGGDHLVGSSGDDHLSGGRGPDKLVGGEGFDMLRGGKGKDILIDDPHGAFFDGGRGDDTLDFSAFTGHIGVDLSSPAHKISVDLQVTAGAGGMLDYTVAGKDRLNAVGIENVTAGAGNDLLRGSNGANILDGGAGNDRLEGLGGNDILIGGAGDDILVGGRGNDTMSGGSGKDSFVLQPGSGHDRILDFDIKEDVLVLSGFGEDGAITWVEYRADAGNVIGMRGFLGDGSASVILMGIKTADGIKIAYEQGMPAAGSAPAHVFGEDSGFSISMPSAIADDLMAVPQTP